MESQNYDFVVPESKVIRMPSLKRGKDDIPLDDRVKLERVLGLTVGSNAALDCDSASEQVAYPAGMDKVGASGFKILPYGSTHDEPIIIRPITALLTITAPKPRWAPTFVPFLTLLRGDNHFHSVVELQNTNALLCTVILFNIKKNKQSHILNTSRKTITCLAFGPGGKYLATGECGHVPSLRIWSVHDGVQVAEFQGHKYGINCVAFSPNNKYVVSVGSQHDMIVNVWDWKNNVKVASNKVSTRVKAVSFSENGKYFVTVGMRHVKFWYLEHTRSAKYNEPVPLTGRSAILGEQRDNYFCDVACGLGKMGDSTYAITKSGLLCEFSIRRLLDKWVELRTRSANCMTVGENFIFIGCADGIIRCFSPLTLEFLVTLPRTHYLGVDVALGLDISHLLTHPQDAKYPDAVALAYDEVNKKLTCVYNDHSMYVWDVHEIRRVGKSHSFLYHSACIWGVEIYPEIENQERPVPSGSFITCSSDDTIRVWNLSNIGSNNPTVYKKNIYSNELLKVLYIDKNLTYLKDLDLSTSSSEKTDTSYDGKNGVRSVRISPDGQHLASGDREGNIRIHELSNLQQTVMIEAHDAEVLCLEYTKEPSEHLLASASRDRLIHVFNASKGYECMQTLDDHSSSITAVRFINTRGQLQMVSCSADKSIIFRQFHPTSPGGTKQFIRDHNVSGKTTLYDMEVDCSQKHIMTACQDRNIRVYNVNSGKHSKTFKGSVSEDGTLIKVSLDNSGIYIATSCTDKSLSIYDYYSGECMATMLGHSELVTGLKFTNDCKRLISASGDGCIFIWKLPRDMTVTMQARLDQQAVRRGKRTVSLQSGLGLADGPELVSDEEPESSDVDRNSNTEKIGFKFSVCQLPAWARREIEDQKKSTTARAEPTDSPEQPIRTGFSVIKVNKPPQGRWAQRIENNEIMIATFSPDKQKYINEPTSKDSSLESQLERSEDLQLKELQGNEGIDFDGDIEDSDMEIETHYYPASSDNNKNEFTVNASNLEELRRSSRKYKKQQLMKARSNSLGLEPMTHVSNPGTSVSGSQDSDDDDDLEDVSSETETPSIERSLGLNINSMSTESLDLFGQRENYFKNNFESMHSDLTEGRKEVSGKSITSQYLVRNTAVINAAKQTKSEIEKMKKREELKKRLEDTRRTLKISGLSPSPLKASQSICDLSRYPERSSASSQSNYQTEKGKRKKAINLLTILSYPTNLNLDSEGKKSWVLDKLTRNSVLHSKVKEVDTNLSNHEPRVKSAFLSYKCPAEFSIRSNSRQNQDPLSHTAVEHSNFNRKISNPTCMKNIMKDEKKVFSFHCHINGNVKDYNNDGDENCDGVSNVHFSRCRETNQNFVKINSTEKAQIIGLKKSEKTRSATLGRADSVNFPIDSNLSLPGSPVSEIWIPTTNVNVFNDLESENKKIRKRRSCSFYVDWQSTVDRRKETEEKERLLLAHDQMGFENSQLKMSNDETVEGFLDDNDNESDDEFSSDSLESESFGQKSPRRCVSDYQIFSKEFKRSLSLSSQRNTEDFSDTDFSGLNSLQGSGDLLEMQERDFDMEILHCFERQNSGSLSPSRSPFPRTISILSDQCGTQKLRNSESPIKLNHEGEIDVEELVPKKSDAFFVEIKDSPRKNRSTLTTTKFSSEVMPDGFEEVKSKSPYSSRPIIGGKLKKVNLMGRKLSLKCVHPVLPDKITQDQNLDDEEGLRRAISLSDLSASALPQTVSSQVSGKGLTKSTKTNEYNNTRLPVTAQPMVRCSSMGVLSRLDPNADMNHSETKKIPTGKGLMRPTISSQNKVATTVSKMTNPGLTKRRIAAFSSVNLTTVGINDDSSSEETGLSRGNYPDKNNFNCGQRRQGNLGRYGSLKDLSHKAKEVTQRLTTSTINTKKNKNQKTEKNLDVTAAPLTKQLCSSVTTQLSQDIDNLIVLHKRLTLEVDKSQNRPQLEQMAEDLEKLAIETQQKLNSLTSKLKNNNSVIRNQLSTNTSNFLGNNLGLIAPNNVTSAPNSFLTSSNNPNLMTNVDVSRISEMLISVVQQYTENQQNNQKT